MSSQSAFKTNITITQDNSVVILSYSITSEDGRSINSLGWTKSVDGSLEHVSIHRFSILALRNDIGETQTKPNCLRAFSTTLF